MLTTAEAREAIFRESQLAAAENVPVATACCRALRQSITAERDQPPFDRVTMDGIAIAHADFASGLRNFPIQATQAAGDPALTLSSGNCIEIMTGASLPAGADCVIPVERLAVAQGSASIETDYAAEQGQFIHARGSDHVAGTRLLGAGTKISPMDIAVISSCGVTEVSVSRLPKIRVISTGNELVPAGQPIQPHQIRLSNGPAIISMLGVHGFVDTLHDHIVDDPEILARRIGEHLDAADVLVLSGGVSMGKADYLPGVFHALGVDVVFHKVSQRPGKPMWFGIGPERQAVFALPGNPVSALVCSRHYVIPALNAAAGLREAAPEFANLAQDVIFKPKLTNFLPVRLASSVGGPVLAMPVHTNTSGDFTALSGTDGYVELALEQSEFPAGSTVRLYRW